MSQALYKVRDFHNFRDLLMQSVELYGDSPAFKVKNKIGQIYDISYNRFREDIDSLGTALLRLGLLGKRVAVAGANSYKWCTSYLSIGGGVGIVVPVDKELPFADIRSIIETAEVDAVIFDAKFGEKLLEHREELSEKIIYICMDSKDDADGILSYDKLLEGGRKYLVEGDEAYTSLAVEGNKLTVLLFTSGTTGMAKAIMLSADNICSDVRSIMGIVKINKGERILSILPIHHTYECTVTFLCCIYGGVTICFCEGLRHMTKNFEEYRPNILIVVPLVLEKFYKRIEKSIQKEPGGKAKVGLGSFLTKTTKAFGFDSSSLFFGQIKKAFGGEIRLIISGAAGIDSKIITEMNKFGITCFQGYGLTECAPIVICNNDKNIKTDSIGKPIPGVQAKIFNEDENGIGEICIKGPMVMLGYYRDEEATKAAFDYDGWFHTGDMGRVDEEGFYYICGRCKSVIVTTNGKNVYPEELEAMLMDDGMIKECLVFGGHDHKGNTIVSAKIFPDIRAISEKYGNRNLTENEIGGVIAQTVKNVNDSVVSYKAIKQFEIVKKEFEKTTTSKIKRNQV